MIIAQTEKGTITNINSWATYKPDSPIKQLILTDGRRLIKVIRGCEKYYAEREGISNINSQQVIKESIVGINDLSSIRKEFLDVYNEKMKQLRDKYPDPKEKLEKLKSRYDAMLKNFETYEVIKFSLEFTQETFLLEDFNRDMSLFKSGKKKNITLENILGKRYWTNLVV